MTKTTCLKKVYSRKWLLWFVFDDDEEKKYIIVILKWTQNPRICLCPEKCSKKCTFVFWRENCYFRAKYVSFLAQQFKYCKLENRHSKVRFFLVVLVVFEGCLSFLQIWGLSVHSPSVCRVYVMSEATTSGDDDHHFGCCCCSVPTPSAPAPRHPQSSNLKEALEQR